MPSLKSYPSACSTRWRDLLSASMMRDLEQGAQVEADHIVGDMLARGEAKGLDLPMLRLAYAHLKAYEVRRTHP